MKIAVAILLMAISLNAGCTIKTPDSETLIPETANITKSTPSTEILPKIESTFQSSADKLMSPEETERMIYPYDAIGGDYTFHPANMYLSSPGGAFEQIPDSIYDLIEKHSKNEEWHYFLENLPSPIQHIPTRISEDSNIYSAILFNNLPVEEVKEALEYAMAHDNWSIVGYYLSPDDLEVILSMDEELIVTTFMSDAAIVKGVNYYTGLWLYYNDIDAYEKNHLTPEEIFWMLNQIRTRSQSFYSSIIPVVEHRLCKYIELVDTNLTVEDVCGYERDMDMPLYSDFIVRSSKDFGKFSNYTNYFWEPFNEGFRFEINDVRHDKLEKYEILRLTDLILPEDDNRNISEFIQKAANKTTLLKGDRFYSFAWVYYNKPETYKSEGITPEELISMIPQYEELELLTDEAMTALKNKFYDYQESYSLES